MGNYKPYQNRDGVHLHEWLSIMRTRGSTALHYAVTAGHSEAVEVLVARNANVNAQSGSLRTPLHVAAALGRTGIVKILLSAEADVNIRNDSNETPGMEAGNHMNRWSELHKQLCALETSSQDCTGRRRDAAWHSLWEENSQNHNTHCRLKSSFMLCS